MRGHHLPRAARGETQFPCDPLRDRLNKNRPRRIRDATAGFHRRAERGGLAGRRARAARGTVRRVGVMVPYFETDGIGREARVVALKIATERLDE